MPSEDYFFQPTAHLMRNGNLTAGNSKRQRKSARINFILSSVFLPLSVMAPVLTVKPIGGVFLSMTQAVLCSCALFVPFAFFEYRTAKADVAGIMINSNREKFYAIHAERLERLKTMRPIPFPG